MKIDVYCILLDHPRRFGLRASANGIPPMTYARVPALPEMLDSQIVRQALETTAAFLELLGEEGAGTRIDIHLDDPPPNFRSGHFVPRFEDGHDDGLLESINRLKALLATPKDLQFKRSPNGGNLI